MLFLDRDRPSAPILSISKATLAENRFSGNFILTNHLKRLMQGFFAKPVNGKTLR